MNINKGSYSYTVVLKDWICEAELYSYADTVTGCIEEIFGCSFVETNNIETITIRNYAKDEGGDPWQN